MQAFVDLLLIGIIICYVIVGLKRGFVRSLFSVLVKFVSFIIAFFVSGKFAPVLYDSYFRDGVVRNIESRIDSSVPVGLTDQVSTALSSIPNVLAGAAKMFGVDSDMMEETVRGTDLTADLAVSLEGSVIGPVVTAICRIIIFAIVSAVASLVFGAIVDIISGFAKLPVLRTADSLFGAGLGLINGFLCVLIISYFLVIAASLIDNSEIIDIIDSSVLISLFTKTSLFI